MDIALISLLASVRACLQPDFISCYEIVIDGSVCASAATSFQQRARKTYTTYNQAHMTGSHYNRGYVTISVLLQPPNNDDKHGDRQTARQTDNALVYPVFSLDDK